MQNNPYVSSPGTVAAAALKDSTKNVYLCTDMIRLPFVASSRFKIAKLICCSSPTAVEIFSLRYLLKVHTILVLCFSSNIIDLSIFIDVYSCFFVNLLIFYCFTVWVHPSAAYFQSFEPSMTESIYFQSLQHALIKSIGHSQTIPAVLLTGPSFATCS